MKVFALLLCSVLALSASAEEASDADITIYTEINHPYLFIDEKSGEHIGLGLELLNELMKRAELTPNIVVLPWMRAMKQHKEDSNSCLYIMNRTPERESKFEWVGPMITSGLALYVRPDSNLEIFSLRELKDYTVIGKVDSVSIEGLEEIYKAKVVVANSDEQAIKMFYKGRGDFWAAGRIDGPLAARYLGLPPPKLAMTRSTVDLSMGCSLELSVEKLSKLRKAHETMSEFTSELLENHSYFKTQGDK